MPRNQANPWLAVQPLYFTSQNFSNDVFQLNFYGTAGTNYILQASTNLVDWTAISTNVSPVQSENSKLSPGLE